LTVDLQLLKAVGVSAVFMPTYDSLYPDDYAYEVDEKQFSRELCGANRSGHFTGVLTVVMKLLNLVKPQKAYFGEKDFQQLSLVKGMVEAFFLETEIIGCPIIREDDGLAMSSRNLNLKSGDRRKSPLFNKLLSNAMLSDEEIHTRLGLAVCVEVEPTPATVIVRISPSMKPALPEIGRTTKSNVPASGPKGSSATSNRRLLTSVVITALPTAGSPLSEAKPWMTTRSLVMISTASMTT
jgi:hypothetical protein